MADIDWPEAFGYAAFSEQAIRSRGPHVHRSVYTGRPHVSYGGGRRRQGYVVTPVSTTGMVQEEITALVQAISDPSNRLRLPLPTTDTDVATWLTVHVTRIQPPERNERGTWRGWRLDWVEAVGSGSTATLPAPTGRITRLTLTGTNAVVEVDFTNWRTGWLVTGQIFDRYQATRMTGGPAFVLSIPYRETTIPTAVTLWYSAGAIVGSRASFPWSP